jgi:hypothetical protein
MLLQRQLAQAINWKIREDANARRQHAHGICKKQTASPPQTRPPLQDRLFPSEPS